MIARNLTKAALAITNVQHVIVSEALRGSFDLRIISTAARTCVIRGSSRLVSP